MTIRFSVFSTAVLAAALGLAACSEAPTSPADAVLTETSFARAGALPNGAKWADDPTLFVGGTDGDYAYMSFRIQGAGNAKGLTVLGEANAKLIVECTKRNGRGRELFERTYRLNGSGTFPIDRNGWVTGQLAIYRANGNAQAREFCKSQNFDLGEVLSIITLGKGTFVEAPSPLGRYYFQFDDVLPGN